VSAVLCFVGLLVTFYTLLFIDVPHDRAGKPKPPLAVQLLHCGYVFAAGLPGVAWGVVRAARNLQKTPWE
jgi:hypothetical protein